jgi:hypothetical protein
VNKSKELKKQLLGEMGSALIQQFVVSQGYYCFAPWDVYHRSCDLVIQPDPVREPNVLYRAQVKCKVPFVTKGSQSFTSKQWLHYQGVDIIYFICSPVVGEYEHMDIWKGRIYSGNPKKLQTKNVTTRSGRDMVLIPLDQPELKHEFTIKNQECLDLMKELTTGGFED